MEPRSFERGKLRPIVSSTLLNWLQWSRVRLNAESDSDLELDIRYRCFNGAAFV